CKFIDTPIDRRGINPTTDLKLIIKYLKILNTIKPDICITYTIKPNIYAGILSRMRKIPYVVNITGLGTTFQTDGLLKSVIVWLYRVACKEARKILFENYDNMHKFINYKITTKEKAQKLNGAGVNLDEYQFTNY